ncbi:MAG TPA: FGGY family carbohydrate kinase, partial [Egibacteraceae bacterium]|nr:FGGY family carbohydrate kinase [Egibacteraceae bacterium]
MIIGLDLGTTSAKAVGVAEDGTAAAVCTAVYPQQPESRARQAPEAALGAAMSVLAEAVAAVGPASVRGIALSAAMHTLLSVDASGAAHGGVSTWGDARAAALPDGSAHRADLASLYELTGCPPWPVYAPA